MAGPKILSLFSGVGGLELAIGLALPGSEVVGYVERDAYASAALMARMEESSMDLAPIFCGDIRQLDGRPLRGHVDVVCGGIPCQPYSVAGAQQGNEDDRALWPEFARIVEECGPALVFIENVPTFVTGAGFRSLGEELSRMGYEIADPLFIGAGDVGAPHVRRRVFILAYPKDGNRGSGEHREEAGAWEDQERGRGSSGGGEGGSMGRGEVPDAVSNEVRDEPERGGGGAQEAERRHPVAGDLGLFPPGPDDFETWGAVIDIAPHLVPAIEPGFRCVVDGISVVLDESRADQIRCAGNAVVVAQAYVAFRQLMEWVKGKDDV